jgi:hypothetical protein
MAISPETMSDTTHPSTKDAMFSYTTIRTRLIAPMPLLGLLIVLVGVSACRAFV